MVMAADLAGDIAAAAVDMDDLTGDEARVRPQQQGPNPARSSGSPRRPSGCWRAMPSARALLPVNAAARGVRVSVGAIPLILTLGASSAASERTRPRPPP